MKNCKLSATWECKSTGLLFTTRNKPNNPRRPIIYSVDCLTTRLFVFVDHYLKPAVKNLKSNVKDTNDFIKTKKKTTKKKKTEKKEKKKTLATELRIHA